MAKQFKLIGVLEGVAIGIVGAVGGLIGRPDLIVVWIAVVVGLHFLPLARIFQAPLYYAAGAVITLWSILSWVFLRSNVMAISAGLGTGIVLWAACAYNVVRAQQLVRSIPGTSN